MKSLRRLFNTVALAAGLVFLSGGTVRAQSKDTNRVTAAAPVRDHFQRWLDGVRRDARAQGVSRRTIAKALPDTLRPVIRVLELDTAQPEVKRTFDEYLTLVVSEKRVTTGRSKMQECKAQLDTVSGVYGPAPEMIVALWGVETNFGQNTGGFDVVPALSTLAYDGRRAAFFRSELFFALKIVDEGHISLDSLKGSWAGALGQVQFMPSSFSKLAVDFDKDGRKDIWGNLSDVFASAAHYLQQAGWKKGQGVCAKVEIPAGFNRGLLGLEQKHPLSVWRKKGVRFDADSTMLGGDVYIIQPGGAGTTALAVTENFKVIMRWNNSQRFAAAAGLIANEVKKNQP